MDELREWNDNDDNMDSKIDAAMKFMADEFSNHVGFLCTIKTYESDYLGGKICGVRHNCVQLTDDQGNRIGCDLFVIALWCIINPKTQEQVVSGKAKKAKKAVKKKAKKSNIVPKPKKKIN